MIFLLVFNLNFQILKLSINFFNKNDLIIVVVKASELQWINTIK